MIDREGVLDYSRKLGKDVERLAKGRPSLFHDVPLLFHDNIYLPSQVLGIDGQGMVGFRMLIGLCATSNRTTVAYSRIRRHWKSCLVKEINQERILS